MKEQPRRKLDPIPLLIVGFVMIGMWVTAPRPTPALQPTKVKLKVKVTRAVGRQVVDHIDFVGTLQGSKTVEIRSRVGGTLEKVHFEDGQAVRQGDLLFEVDPRLEQAHTDLAEANSRLADERLARKSAAVRRAMERRAQSEISQEELHEIAAAEALARADQKMAHWKRDEARAKLESARIKAPIDGTIGSRRIDPGNLVKADETVLASIVKLDPIHVHFGVDERSFLRVRRLIREGKLDPARGSRLPIRVSLSNQDDGPYRGEVDFSDAPFDTKSGTVHLHAALDNIDHHLMPGSWAHVQIEVGAPHEALLVPEVALMADQRGSFLFVVNEGNVVESRPVKLGANDEGMWVVREGLGAGDRIVLERDLVKEGMTVLPDLESQPAKPPSR